MQEIGKPLLSLEGVGKTFFTDKVQTNALAGIDLRIYEGEFVTIAGPSGCGKSTLLSILGLLDSPTAGRYTINQTAVEKLDHAALARIRNAEIGFVFQDFNLIGDMTVFENVELPLTHRDMSRKDRQSRVMECLERVGMTDRAEHYPAQLSGGQQQRVALARALVFEPQLVLMDEPLGALDKNLREQLQVEIKALHERLGVTIVYVTHDQTEALVLSDRIAIFNRGRIQQLDAPKRVHEYPANAFVASFMGETNLLEGSILGTGEGGRCEVVLKSGARLIGTIVGSSGSAGPRTVAVRPERISVNPPDCGYENLLAGSVVDTVYLGDRMTLRVATDDGSQFTVSGGMESVDNPPSRGTPVRIGWKREHCLVLEAD
jgi:putative spermidine/putrescine transport system ATP-binding protein